MSMIPLKFAKTKVYVDGYLVGKITNVNINVNNSTVETTGAEDIVAGSDILFEQETVIKTGTDLTFDLLSMYDDVTRQEDPGQKQALLQALKGADNVAIEGWKQNGTGKLYVGIIKSATDSSSVGDGIFKRSIAFKANKEPTSLGG